MPDDFTSFFDFCPIGAYRSTPDGRVLRVNAALARLNGFDRVDDLLPAVHDIGAEWYVDPSRRAQFMQALEADGTVTGFVSEVRRYRTQERIWVREHARAVRSDDGTVRFVEGTVEEVTEAVHAQAALRRSEEQLRQITAQLPGMVYKLHVSPDGVWRYEFVSPGVEALCGVTPEEVLADANLLRTMLDPGDRARMERETDAQRRAGGPVHLELRFKPRGSDAERWAQLTSAPVESAEPGYTRVGVVVDITERKLAERLSAQHDRAEAAHVATAEFLSRASHELRTPLNAILGFAQLLEIGTATPAQQVKWVHEILTSGRHLLTLVDDVLDLAAAQSGRQRLDLGAADATMVLDEAWAALEPQAQQHRIVLDRRWPAAAVHVRADPLALKVTLSNLLSNAIKYNRDGGTVSVCARAADGRVEIEVADTGPGLQPEQLPRLFNAFERLDAPARGVPGTGLGLALSRQLVESMGGTIGVASLPGAGTTFTVRLQAA